MNSLYTKILISVLLISFRSFSLVQPSGSAPENNQSYDHFYFFSDKTVDRHRFENPTEFASKTIRAGLIPVTNQLNLLIWQEFHQPLPVPPVPYDRMKQFGNWIVDSRNGTCLNQRGIVLVRDSKDPVGLVPGNKCFVSQGKWLDPYSNRWFVQSKEVQIDHMVPLKHAYVTGAWKWDNKLRCLYTNYMGYRGHLVSASAFENLSKGDSTPYSYLPPNSNYVCTYLAEWLRIKLIWNLALIPPEIQAVANAYKKYNCSPMLFEVSLDELAAQRKWMNDNYNLCDYNVAPSYVNKQVSPLMSNLPATTKRH